MLCAVVKSPGREHIGQGCHQNACMPAQLEVPAHEDEGTPCAVELEQGNEVEADIHIPCGEEHRQQGKRISYHIIVEGLEYIGPFPDVKIPLGNSSRQQCSQIITIIGQGNDMLPEAVAALYECCAGEYKAAVDKECENKEKECECSVIGLRL